MPATLKGLAPLALAVGATLVIASAGHAQIRASFDAADANRDGKVTFGEFQAYATKVAAVSQGAMAATFNQRTPADQAARLHLRFDAADAGHKGYLTRDEFNAMAAAAPAPTPEP